ncbi:sensor histidine kinase [Spirilliplanes yamanashiensis]|uniref:Signal transduction histidine kinase subgroup 3 dimerisation and phosphoacceptor domain-containing protein n=1 Tax=Spirilliplanes yamanashiensis TaxID=42233 RepID=A0A8J3YAV9_9ACTN|nr:histidine kinase [Spirilliplanes yamanashiensis]MDP9818832.1 two-component system sensor histidine kinase DesK [Spirilliplanes yamanashiensis]GIJ05286.1 hypothetical protein Sya03_46380 [Spirilliplanes yamanashiensis]
MPTPPGPEPAATPAGLAFLRWLTAGTLAGTAVLAAALTLGDLPRRQVPLGAAVVAAAGLSAAVLLAAVLAPARPGWFRWALPPAGAAALGACAAGQAGGGQLWPWVALPALAAAAALTGTDLPRAPLAALAAGVTGAASAAATADWVTGAGAAAATALSLAAIMAQVWVWEVAVGVDRARRAEAASAVTAERNRFAAELHDIQGHSLQVIVLKSELAARLAGTDPDRAAAEMRAVEALARDALRDTRDVVHGYRPVSLAAEIANAVQVLAAAGVRCRTAVAAVPAAHERLLALVVREATTNVLRHSAAADAAITCASTPDGTTLTVTNDAPLDAAAGAGGGGLPGLARRLGDAGGRVRWRREPAGFTVVATLPGEPR